jgi:hypothetical protein
VFQFRKRLPSARNQRRINKKEVSKFKATHVIPPENIAEYTATYDAWERELVEHLDGQPRSIVHDAVDERRDYPPARCHHNVEAYCRSDHRATPVLGWLQDRTGYVMHSLIEIDGELFEVTPSRLPFPQPLPFVRDGALRVGCSTESTGCGA